MKSAIIALFLSSKTAGHVSCDPLCNGESQVCGKLEYHAGSPYIRRTEQGCIALANCQTPPKISDTEGLDEWQPFVTETCNDTTTFASKIGISDDALKTAFGYVGSKAFSKAATDAATKAKTDAVTAAEDAKNTELAMALGSAGQAAEAEKQSALAAAKVITDKTQADELAAAKLITDKALTDALAAAKLISDKTQADELAAAKLTSDKALTDAVEDAKAAHQRDEEGRVAETARLAEEKKAAAVKKVQDDAVITKAAGVKWANKVAADEEAKRVAATVIVQDGFNTGNDGYPCLDGEKKCNSDAHCCGTATPTGDGTYIENTCGDGKGADGEYKSMQSEGTYTHVCSAQV